MWIHLGELISYALHLDLYLFILFSFDLLQAQKGLKILSKLSPSSAKQIEALSPSFGCLLGLGSYIIWYQSLGCSRLPCSQPFRHKPCPETQNPANKDAVCHVR